METIDKIRAEVERLKEMYLVNQDKFKIDDTDLSIPYEGKAKMCGEVLAFLDTLQEPEVDLSEAYQEFCKDYPFPWSSQYVNREYIDELCLSVARHFFELGKNAKQ